MGRSGHDPNIKPPPNICPGKYCFHFLKAGALFASGLHDSVESAQRHMDVVQEDRCGCTFGICTRINSMHGDNDWFEPHDVNMIDAGLPWFYFIPHPFKVTEEDRAQYIEESEALWGRNHWFM